MPTIYSPNACSICGSEGTILVYDNYSFCSDCTEKYFVWYCRECGFASYSVDIPRDPLCWACFKKEGGRMEREHIFHRNFLRFLAKKELVSCKESDSLDLEPRYKHLKE
jgi:hypothetical protein